MQESIPSAATERRQSNRVPKTEAPVVLVPFRSKQTVRAKGGDIEDALKKRGFRLNFKELEDIPRSCSGGFQLEVHYLELGNQDEPLSLEKAIEVARNDGLVPACSCEFGEAILSYCKDPTVPAADILPKNTTFFSLARRKGISGEGVAIIANEGNIYAVKKGNVSQLRKNMVLVCVPERKAKKRK